MQISGNSNLSFNGILIKNTSFEHVRNIAMTLKFRGYHPLGFKRLYLAKENVFEMGEKVREIRGKGLSGNPKEFGTLYFPWSRAAYLIAPRKSEPEIYKEVIKINPEAVFNMLV